MGDESGGCEVVKLAEAAKILGVSVRAAESALRRGGVQSGYPRGAVVALSRTLKRRAPRTVRPQGSGD